MDEWLWMCSLPGFYRKETERLLQCFGSPEQVIRASERQIQILPFLTDRQKRILTTHKRKTMKEIRYNLEKTGIKFISCMDLEYPKRLLQMEDYPFGLFYLGELPGQDERCVAVVGARMCTNYGKGMANEIGEMFARDGISLISGMAYGVDGMAQAACLNNQGRSYAITGCGVDICYPTDHMALYRKLAAGGGVISEYPPGTPVRAFHFPMRNRLISGLCECVIVVEAKKKSGSLITADLALDQGKDVLAIPGRITDPLSDGCNQLIAQGAGIVTSMEDIREHLGIDSENMKKTKKITLSLQVPKIWCIFVWIFDQRV